jgi:putative addiction module component (TIGR02574 family)
MSGNLSFLVDLDIPQKLELIGVLWQSIDAPETELPMSDELVAELDRRKAAAEQDPDSLVPWETIRQRVGLPNA